MGFRERRVGECFLHDALAVVERAAYGERPDVAAPTRELVRLQFGDAALRIQHDDVDPRLAVKCGRDCAAGVARGRNQNGQLAALIAADALHARGQEARAEILEGAGRSMEQLQHRQRRRRVRQTQERRREVERFVADRRQLGSQRIAGCERRQQSRGDLRQLDVGFELPRREVRKFLGNVQPAVRRDAARDGFAKRHGLIGVAGADVMHVGRRPRSVDSGHSRMRAPAGSRVEIQASLARRWAANPATIASRIRSACCCSHQAKTVGPAPEIEHPSAPFAMAPSLTVLKPGISTWRCGSMITSSSDSRISCKSPVKHPVRNPARFADCQITSDRSMERLRICLASRVDSIMCGCTSTQRTVDGTGICLTLGLSMPTVSTSPPYSDGAMLSTCTEPLATASPFIANLSSSSLPSGSGSSAFAATTAATADAAEPPRPEPSGMPLSIDSSMPKSSFRSRTMQSTPMPAVLRSGSRGRSTTVPVTPTMRTPGCDTRLAVTRSPIAWKL